MADNNDDVFSLSNSGCGGNIDSYLQSQLNANCTHGVSIGAVKKDHLIKGSSLPTSKR